MAERTHAALMRETLGDRLVGHISRDGMAIEAREKPVKNPVLSEVEVLEMPEAQPANKKRGRFAVITFM